MAVRNNRQKYTSLRKKYPVFSYQSYHYRWVNKDTLEVGFVFEVGDDHTFRPSWLIRFGPQALPMLLSDIEERMVFQLGMIEMLSYWKAFCSPVIRLNAGHLSFQKQSWWKKLYHHGLGEFFYSNGIAIPGDELLAFEHGPDVCPETSAGNHSCADGANKALNAALLPIGGGKDSVVTLELLKAAGVKLIPFVVNPREATDHVLLAGGLKPSDGIIMERKIDQLLLTLNGQGYLNGHTPFSALLAFASTFAAFLCNIPVVALSNESSASEPTIPGTNINHQYSKSFEFELDFRHYIQAILGGKVNYFSLLRPLNELQIAAFFARFTQYHPVFKSCNAGSKLDIWCCVCPKCLFTFVILAPFLYPERLTAIFGMDLFEEQDLMHTLDELCGLTGVKPFECVGTIDEVNMALTCVVGLLSRDQKPLPLLLNHYANGPLYGKYRSREIMNLLEITDNRHCLPDQLLNFLNKELMMSTSMFSCRLSKLCRE